MHLLDLTLPTAAENLALDEALLDEAEAAGEPRETLRLWEPAAPLVVVGRSSKVAVEVRLDACRELNIPVLRRKRRRGHRRRSGLPDVRRGLSLRLRPELRAVDRAHQFVLGRLAAALQPFAPGLQCRGISDLAIGPRKVSGNSVRCKREHLLYHGTLLYDFQLDLIDRCLRMPPREPDYRAGRPHADFVANLPPGEPRALARGYWSIGSRHPRADARGSPAQRWPPRGRPPSRLSPGRSSGPRNSWPNATAAKSGT